MPVKSLLHMSRESLLQAQKKTWIDSVGEVPYWVIRDVLLKVESAEQLRKIEINSPQIIGEDGEIWLSFIKRDIPDWHLKPHEPEDPKNWWKVYRKLKEEVRQKALRDESILKATLANIKNEKEQNTAVIATGRHLPLQGPGRRAKIHYDYISGRTGSKGAHKMSLMEKIRKEARDGKASKMNRPMHELQKRATAVKAPPQQFVEDMKRKTTKAMSPPLPPATVRTSRPPLHAPRPTAPPAREAYDLTADREARLRALKNGTAHPASAPAAEKQPSSNLTLTFLEDSDGEDKEVEQPRKLLKVDDERPRPASPLRLQQRPTMKRKQAPSLFMSSPKRVAKPPNIS
ncbi:hypothetical protein LTR99_001897 [Exophiala xenobiotica]|uniref:Elongin-A n=1 Tax=Vermiconidia calcicola TaxID=1690605 RepID=A0AAV9Q613_9PEZI|nr:hypothetical protein LTR96_002136 [Exophiala xenobiotica]KAK5536665.1 hypothetical protein LTR25_005339 [Vermiconidia calcicola]KAK5540437.1 hypothetical protein LTR23_006322 [Chaetothyriales sp. CCFEE 6169]KAK5306207.1 hypothetical protein LTR99_001897 [Exophiala xenobiotica]KAK5341813.1 hypothetical protein LTR98_002607 [Exophiala xenobiotica]